MRVLVATDGSDAAERACRTFVSLLGDRKAEVRVFTVLSYEFYPYAMVAGEHLADEAERVERVQTEIDRSTHAPGSFAAAAGHAVSIAHRFGNPSDEILTEIEQWRPDLVVVGRRGARGLERWLGSVSEHVVRRAGVPVLVVP
jgi:nucleotide-binding universal stress UspA family protein